MELSLVQGLCMPGLSFGSISSRGYSPPSLGIHVLFFPGLMPENVPAQGEAVHHGVEWIYSRFEGLIFAP
jgi:hypothetical protein